MTKTISVHSYRGGTGKSNICANVATMLAAQGKRVAVIDTDIQSPGVHVVLGLDSESIKYSLNDYLWDKCSIEEATYDVTGDDVGPNGGKVFLVPSSVQLNDIARILREGYDANRLNEGVRALNSGFDLDVLIIDTHPGLNEETLLSIAISDMLFVVLRPDQQDYQGTSATVRVARQLRVPSLHLIVNKLPPNFSEDNVRETVEATYNSDVAAVISFSPEMMELGSRSVFVKSFPEHATTSKLKNIVSIIDKDL